MWVGSFASLNYLSFLSFSVFLGNWNEDIARQEVAAKDYEARRSTGDLLYLKKRKEINFQTVTVPHSFSPDGLLRYGQTVQLTTLSNCAISCNAFMTVYPGAVRCTAGSTLAPQARNTVVITRAGGTKGGRIGINKDDNIVRYGDRIILECNPSLVVDPTTKIVGLPFLLHSTLANNVLGNTRKGRQEVVWTTKRDADAEWSILAASGDRLMTDGEPVHSKDTVSLLHCMSNVLLSATDKETYPTDFGSELDIHAQTHHSIGRASMNSSGELPYKPSQPENTFQFLLATDPSASTDHRGFRSLTPETLTERARELLANKCGVHGLHSFSLALSALDAKGTGAVQKDGVRWALYEHGVNFTEDEFNLFLSAYENSKQPGYLSGAGFLKVLQGNLYSASRAQAVEEAFHHFSSSASPVTYGHLLKSFDARWDPRARNHQLTVEEAKAEFSRQWPQHRGASAVITSTQFEQYYQDVAACMDNELEFIEMVYNVWHVPNAGCWKQKKSKRVLVTLHKGSSTEALIPNGEDIADEDFDGLTAALGRMGIGGIARVKVLGLVETD